MSLVTSRQPQVAAFHLGAALLALLTLWSGGVAFYSQATSAGSYASLLRSVLVSGCIPQVLMLALLWLAAQRKLALIGLMAVVISWSLVADLAMRAI